MIEKWNMEDMEEKSSVRQKRRWGRTEYDLAGKSQKPSICSNPPFLLLDILPTHLYRVSHRLSVLLLLLIDFAILGTEIHMA